MSFNIADVLKNVSDSDTGREQIEYIRQELLEADPGNFYQLGGIEELAANIDLCGLQQPLRVRAQGDSGRYTIVSGHRRNAAVALLARDNPERWQEVPCIVERDEASPALRQLRLIYANANTRTMSSAELSEQAAQVEKLLYQLKEEGYEFPGRMRDHVAQAVKASKTKLARLKVIRENLAEGWQQPWKAGTISEDAAYSLAHLPKADQQLILCEKTLRHVDLRHLSASDIKRYDDYFSRIRGLDCDLSGGGACKNADRQKAQVVSGGSYRPSCGACCEECDSLATCKNACPLLAEQVKLLKSERKEERRREKETQAEKDRPKIEYIQGVYARVGQARRAAGVTVEQLYEAKGAYYAKTDDEVQERLESGNAKITPDTPLPFGYSFPLSCARRLCAVADVLHCSIDYLLGREEIVSESDTWHTGTPEQPGQYATITMYAERDTPNFVRLDWDGERWTYSGIDLLDDVGAKVLHWIPLPPDAEDSPEIVSDSDATGEV